MTDAEVSDLTESIAKKVMRLLMREGLLDKDGEVVANPDCDDVFRDHEGLAAASSASHGKIWCRVQDCRSIAKLNNA